MERECRPANSWKDSGNSYENIQFESQLMCKLFLAEEGFRKLKSVTFLTEETSDGSDTGLAVEIQSYEMKPILSQIFVDDVFALAIKLCEGSAGAVATLALAPVAWSAEMLLMAAGETDDKD